MKKTYRRWTTAAVLAGVILIPLAALAQRTGYSREEFERRRNALAAGVKEGMIVLFGEPLPHPGSAFRQDNDFYYLSGLEDENAILVIAAPTAETTLFLPRQTPREMMYEGANLLADERRFAASGLAAVYDLSFFDEFVARNRSRFAVTWFRLQPRDTLDTDRGETLLFEARKNRNPYNDLPSLDSHRLKKFLERHPSFDVRDVTPHIDALRLIKSREEIEILRRNGRLSAEAVKRAMLASGPGVYEYEVEAAALHWIAKHGARGPAYPPIVGSGPNSCILHYARNDRKAEAGDLLLMDFGATLDYLCMDITRTWPVSGRFTPEQREAYEIVLLVLNACLEAYRPGVTDAQVKDHVDRVLNARGVDGRGLTGGIGHYVGLCVHDVGPRGLPLQEGMVFAIEPGLYDPQKNLGIRIEETVLITRDGCEVLSADVPKEVEDIEKLLARRK
ncbi:MAG: aminopeptidase P family protein [Candidatus Aminicenantes bacterium]|nr:aminopeptidase P family protein [Candidatus Aminicenantes bacterium]